MRSPTLVWTIASLLLWVGVLLSADYITEYDSTLKEYFKSRTTEEYVNVARKFQALANREDAGDLRSNAFYWAGESFYAAGNYLLALSEFDQVLLIPSANKEEDARLKVALCNVRLQRDKVAKWELEKFIKDFPDSPHIDRAKQELEKIRK